MPDNYPSSRRWSVLRSSQARWTHKVRRLIRLAHANRLQEVGDSFCVHNAVQGARTEGETCKRDKADHRNAVLCNDHFLPRNDCRQELRQLGFCLGKISFLGRCTSGQTAGPS